MSGSTSRLQSAKVNPCHTLSAHMAKNETKTTSTKYLWPKNIYYKYVANSEAQLNIFLNSKHI